MQRRAPLTILTATLLAGILAVGVAPGMVCGSTTDCPAMEAGADCHDPAPAPDHCGEAQIDRNGDCCGYVKGDATPPSPEESAAPIGERLEAGAAGPAAAPAVADATGPWDALAGRILASGRTLLALHQTLLI